MSARGSVQHGRLEAQRKAVTDFLDGGNWQLVAEAVEVESGKRSDRPKLAEALSLCRAHRATLIIAKLDRLARNVAFVSNLMESGVEFVAVDFPQANRLTIHILAAVAEHEASMISARTKAALAAARARGVQLGGFRGRAGTAEECRKARAELSHKADEHALALAPILARIDPHRSLSLRQIARALTEEQVPTPRGCSRWTAGAVSRLRTRLGICSVAQIRLAA